MSRCHIFRCLCLSATTANVAPAAPDSLVMSLVSATSATVSFSAVPVPAGRVIVYSLEGSLNNGLSFGAVAQTTMTTFTATGLLPSTGIGYNDITRRKWATHTYSLIVLLFIYSIHFTHQLFFASRFYRGRCAFVAFRYVLHCDCFPPKSHHGRNMLLLRVGLYLHFLYPQPTLHGCFSLH